MDLLISLFSDIQPGRLVESLVLLGVFWAKIKPHLQKIENRMEGMEDALNRMGSSMSEGFAEGDARFESLELRVGKLETTKQGE